MLTNKALKVLKRIFDSEKAISAKSVWEKTSKGYKYVLTAHGLLSGNKPILLSKFILWTDENKQELSSNNLTWLYDVNCVYRSKSFTDESSLETVLKGILTEYQFGHHLRKLSEITLMGAASKMNNHFASIGIKNISVYSLVYQPLHTVKPCEATTFDYKLSINEQDMLLTVRRDNEAWKIDVVLGDERASEETAYVDHFIETACKAVLKLIKK